MKKLIPLTLSLINLFALKANAQANTSLSNLTSPTAVNVDLLPGSKHTFDLGGEKFSWKSLYLSGGIYIEGAKFISNTGSYSTFIGKQAGQANNGNDNVGVGYQTLFSNSEGSFNTGTGFFALYSNTSGSNNTANGAQSLLSNTIGYNNTAYGWETLYLNTTGHDNTAIGDQALYSNTTGYENTATGEQTLFSNTTGVFNIANGYRALYLNTVGSYNTAIGYQALYANTTGVFNTANGYQALYANTAGNYNTANGYQALYNNTTGVSNTANGLSALYNNTSGVNNTAYGSSALVSNTTGTNNTASGDGALIDNTTGIQNTAMGVEALLLSTTGSSNTVVGYSTFGNAPNNSNSSAFGSNAAITASNQVRIGNNAVTSIGGYTNWTNISDARVKKNIKENVPGLAFINLLKPVTYNYDLDAADKIVWPDGRPQPKGFQEPDQLKQLNEQAKQEKEQIAYTGFLAQDVETAAKSIGYDFSGVDAPKNDKDLYGLRYAEFVVPLVKAVQELDAKNNAKDSVIASLQMQIDELKTIVSSQLSGFSNQKSEIDNSQSAILYQNLPNPFNQQTIIKFSLPAQFTSAQINFSDLNGDVLRSFNLSGSGTNQIVMNANQLPAGTYQYSLLIDGKVIDTKQMILTK